MAQPPDLGRQEIRATLPAGRVRQEGEPDLQGPPFNSNRLYNVLFKDESGLAAEAQISVFNDSWH